MRLLPLVKAVDFDVPDKVANINRLVVRKIVDELLNCRGNLRVVFGVKGVWTGSVGFALNHRPVMNRSATVRAKPSRTSTTSFTSRGRAGRKNSSKAD